VREDLPSAGSGLPSARDPALVKAIFKKRQTTDLPSAGSEGTRQNHPLPSAGSEGTRQNHPLASAW